MDHMGETTQMNIELENIKDDEGLRQFLHKHRDILYNTYGSWLNEEMEKRGISAKDIMDKTAISKSFFYAIKNDEKPPSKEMVIKIGITLGLTLDDMNKSLKLAGWKELYSKNRNDAIIINGLQRHMDVFEIDSLLRKYGGDMRLLDKK